LIEGRYGTGRRKGALDGAFLLFGRWVFRRRSASPPMAYRIGGVHYSRIGVELSMLLIV
jgi:hypothetical protein